MTPKQKQYFDQGYSDALYGKDKADQLLEPEFKEYYLKGRNKFWRDWDDFDWVEDMYDYL